VLRSLTPVNDAPVLAIDVEVREATASEAAELRAGGAEAVADRRSLTPVDAAAALARQHRRKQWHDRGEVVGVDAVGLDRRRSDAARKPWRGGMQFRVTADHVDGPERHRQRPERHGQYEQAEDHAVAQRALSVHPVREAQRDRHDRRDEVLAILGREIGVTLEDGSRSPDSPNQRALTRSPRGAPDPKSGLPHSVDYVIDERFEALQCARLGQVLQLD